MVKPNKLIIKLIITNFFVHAGWGLVAPIFAIFVTKQIEGGTVELVGIAVGLHWVVKSTIQPFLAYSMDVIRGEHDDMALLLKGTVIATVIPFLYIFADQMWHVFLLETVRGVGLAMAVPAISGIFTRHVDRHWEAYAWSLQSTGMGFAYGFSAIFGGVIAAILGFETVFILVAFITFLSTALVFWSIKNDPWLQDGTEED